MTKVVRIATSFTRPANTTQYASGDLVANSATAGSVTPLSFVGAGRDAGGSGKVKAVKLKKSTTSVTTPDFRVHLFTASQTVTNGDNGAFVPGDKDAWLGAFDVSVNLACGDGAVGRGAPNQGQEVIFSRAETLYGYVEARDTYTPGSEEVVTAELEVEPN